ncbi:Usherin [Fukomys damarensis]|uniref:Usherin n=1 Tax=Fukomys damarensis TaxID=885580 RepID=A0A091D4H8_FUKDA|nr:Usherin [Fukomys damarensis]
MGGLSLSLGSRFSFRVIEALIFAYVVSISLAASRGRFPRLENVGAFKAVSIMPTQAVCGLPGPSMFCDGSTAAERLQFCTQRLCVQDCPHRASSPPYTALFSAGPSSCIAVDKSDLRPHSPGNSTSFIFGKHEDCFPSLPSPRLGEAFTLAVWLKLEQEGEMCVIEKTVDGQSVFKLTTSEKETMFYYRTVNGLQPPIKVMTLGRILVKKWIHLSVQTHLSRPSWHFPKQSLRFSFTRVFMRSDKKCGECHCCVPANGKAAPKNVALRPLVHLTHGSGAVCPLALLQSPNDRHMETF